MNVSTHTDFRVHCFFLVVWSGVKSQTDMQGLEGVKWVAADVVANPSVVKQIIEEMGGVDTVRATLFDVKFDSHSRCLRGQSRCSKQRTRYRLVLTLHVRKRFTACVPWLFTTIFPMG